MILVNLCGGPGCGKSTSAAKLFADLKLAGYKAELVGEAAKDLVYDQATAYLQNQVLITGMQYQRVLRLAQSGCEIAISDSPLILGAVYANGMVPYHAELKALIRSLESQFETYNVLVGRVKPFDGFGRVQKTEADAKVFDSIVNQMVMEVGDFWLSIKGDETGTKILAGKVLSLLEQQTTAALAA